jgi:cyanophycinase
LNDQTGTAAPCAADIFMKKVIILFIIFFTACLQAIPQDNAGSLVIAGGGLVPGNKNAYSSLVNLAGGPQKATFAIIPAASGVPVRSYAFARNILISYGVDPDNILLVPIATEDDDSTGETDESAWAANAYDEALAERVSNCTGVWFTGGDQVRITRTLLGKCGEPTPLLLAVWEVFHKGGVIGGTSAGAAIMSGIMIGNGTSLGALTREIIYDNGPDNEETDALLLTNGLGFFSEGIVDQHFNARARIGRLAMALMHSTARYSMAFGVDENTVMIYSATDRTVSVAGKAGVTILNASAATLEYKAGLPVIKNLSVSYIEEGDTFHLASGLITPEKGKKPTRGNEYYNRPNPPQGGVLSPNGAVFPDIITINLIDNKGTDTVSNISFADHGAGFRVTFTKKPESIGYYAESKDEEDLYTVGNVRLDIEPVRIVVSEFE